MTRETSTAHLVVRPSTADDRAAIVQLYRAVFPDEDLLPVVRDLLTAHDGVFSLVGTIDGVVVGHVAFTACGVDGGGQRVGLLAPLAVARDHRRQGIGRAMVRDGCARLAAEDVACVCVLGDPAYYGRLGFTPETAIAPPYPLPEAWAGAWQSLALRADGCAPAGSLTVPAMWRRSSLWGP